MRKKLWAAVLLLLLLLLCGCGAKQESPSGVLSWNELEKTGQMPLEYATRFQVDYYGDYAAITIPEVGEYLLVPPEAPVPADLPADMTVLQQPLDRIYLAATSAMDLYRAFGGMDCVRLSALNASGWYIPEAQQALQDGTMVYAGKYSAPDYEQIFAQGCNLAVESTMIYHTPEVKEQLERLGIPVLVERSSYEPHPLGRVEWMKLHALLVGRLPQAEQVFDESIKAIEPYMNQGPTGKTVVFFSISSTGTVTVRKASDYVAKIIELAGGDYLFADLTGDSATSTMTMQMETFFDRAQDADVLIYNSTTVGELKDLSDLFAQSELLRQFRAVEQGSVYCTGKNLFQETTALGPLIREVHRILTEEDPQDLSYLHKLS